MAFGNENAEAALIGRPFVDHGAANTGFVHHSETHVARIERRPGALSGGLQATQLIPLRAINDLFSCQICLCAAVLLLVLTDLAYSETSISWETRVFSGSDGKKQSQPVRSRTYTPRKFPALMSGGPRTPIAPQAPERVAFSNLEPPGTVIIVNRWCRLYYTLSPTEAFEYPISIGRDGFTWTGTEKISRMVDWPDWIPPADMLKRQPELPRRMTGGLNNPLGARALYLGDTLYRIHGTNDTRSIGYAASSGCFRLMNEHVMHLSGLVRIGTPVKVVNDWPQSAVLASGYGTQSRCIAEIPIGGRPPRRQRVRSDRDDQEWDHIFSRH